MLINVYPYGMLMPNRKNNTGLYRYGFNGKENDSEIKGDGNSIDYGARMYDARIGRWLSRDPLEIKYESWSPYHSFANNPILVYDPNGEDWIVVNSDGTYANEIVEDDQFHGFQVLNQDGSYIRYEFNDQENDYKFAINNIEIQKELYNDESAYPIVTFVDEKYVRNLQEEKMSGGERNVLSRHFYAFFQSSGGRMDGIQSLYPDFIEGSMSEINREHLKLYNENYPFDINFFINTDDENNKSYNYHDFGNYNWGGAMRILGFASLDYILDAADNDSKRTHNGADDTGADGQAITDGYNDRYNKQQKDNESNEKTDNKETD